MAAGRIRDQLIRGGGSAEVTIRAFPAIRLLRNSGERIEVRGRDLVIGLGSAPQPGESGGLNALDGFHDVDIELVRFRTGPFGVAAFVLTRSGGGPYAMAAQGRVSAGELARMGAQRLPSVPGDGLLGALGLPLGSREVPMSIQVELASDAGRLRVLSGGGTIAGYPAGPIATAIAAAVARRLEIAP